MNGPCNKVQFPSLRMANTRINELLDGRRRQRRNRPGFLRAYLCPFCDHWHLTRQRAYDKRDGFREPKEKRA